MEPTKDFPEAVREMRRVAPTLSHAGRRAMLHIAAIWDTGFDIDSNVDTDGEVPLVDGDPNMMLMSIPVNKGDTQIGAAEMLIQRDESGGPIVVGRFLPIEVMTNASE